jgi:hypothetical protein
MTLNNTLKDPPLINLYNNTPSITTVHHYGRTYSTNTEENLPIVVPTINEADEEAGPEQPNLQQRDIEHLDLPPADPRSRVEPHFGEVFVPPLKCLNA